jgi:hypothetical protein
VFFGGRQFIKKIKTGGINLGLMMQSMEKGNSTGIRLL